MKIQLKIIPLVTLSAILMLNIANANVNTSTEVETTPSTNNTQTTNAPQPTEQAKTQYSYGNTMAFYVGQSYVGSMSSALQDYYFGKKIDLNKNNGWLFGLSYAKESFKNVFTELSFNYSSFKYNMSKTNLTSTETQGKSSTYLTTYNYDIAINNYYRVNAHALVNTYMPISNNTLNTVLANFNPYFGLGLGLEIINPVYGNTNTNANAKVELPDNAYIAYLFNIVTGFTYNINAKHYVGFNYTYSLKNKEVMFNEFNSYNTSNLKLSYGFRF